MPLTTTTSPATSSVRPHSSTRLGRTPRRAGSAPSSCIRLSGMTANAAGGDGICSDGPSRGGRRHRPPRRHPPQARRADAVRRRRRAGPRPCRARRRGSPPYRRPRASLSRPRLAGLLRFNAGRASRRPRWRKPCRSSARSPTGPSRRSPPSSRPPHQLLWSGRPSAGTAFSRSSSGRSATGATFPARHTRSGTWRSRRGGPGAGRRPTATRPCPRAHPASRTEAAERLVSVGDPRRASGARRPGTRTGARRDRPVQDEGGARRRAGVQLGARHPRALARRPGAALATPDDARHELAKRLRARAGHAPRAGRPARGADRVGELDEADGLLANVGGAGRRPRPRLGARDPRARPRRFVLAARGDLDGAFAAFERALGEHARGTDPFQHARTLLALGRTQRRAKQRGAARATLEDALARFETLGAPLWAEQTRAELARIGGRTRSGGELTEAERRIAGLVAEGRRTARSPPRCTSRSTRWRPHSPGSIASSGSGPAESSRARSSNS